MSPTSKGDRYTRIKNSNHCKNKKGKGKNNSTQSFTLRNASCGVITEETINHGSELNNIDGFKKVKTKGPLNNQNSQEDKKCNVSEKELQDIKVSDIVIFS